MFSINHSCFFILTLVFNILHLMNVFAIIISGETGGVLKLLQKIHKPEN